MSADIPDNSSSTHPEIKQKKEGEIEPIEAIIQSIKSMRPLIHAASEIASTGIVLSKEEFAPRALAVWINHPDNRAQKKIMQTFSTGLMAVLSHEAQVFKPEPEKKESKELNELESMANQFPAFAEQLRNEIPWFNVMKKLGESLEYFQDLLQKSKQVQAEMSKKKSNIQTGNSARDMMEAIKLQHEINLRKNLNAALEKLILSKKPEQYDLERLLRSEVIMKHARKHEALKGLIDQVDELKTRGDPKFFQNAVQQLYHVIQQIQKLHLEQLKKQQLSKGKKMKFGDKMPPKPSKAQVKEATTYAKNHPEVVELTLALDRLSQIIKTEGKPSKDPLYNKDVDELEKIFKKHNSLFKYLLKFKTMPVPNMNVVHAKYKSSFFNTTRIEVLQEVLLQLITLRALHLGQLQEAQFEDLKARGIPSQSAYDQSRNAGKDKILKQFDEAISDFRVAIRARLGPLLNQLKALDPTADLAKFKEEESVQTLIGLIVLRGTVAEVNPLLNYHYVLSRWISPHSDPVSEEMFRYYLRQHPGVANYLQKNLSQLLPLSKSYNEYLGKGEKKGKQDKKVKIHPSIASMQFKKVEIDKANKSIHELEMKLGQETARLDKTFRETLVKNLRRQQLNYQILVLHFAESMGRFALNYGVWSSVDAQKVAGFKKQIENRELLAKEDINNVINDSVDRFNLIGCGLKLPTLDELQKQVLASAGVELKQFNAERIEWLKLMDGWKREDEKKIKELQGKPNEIHAYLDPIFKKYCKEFEIKIKTIKDQMIFDAHNARPEGMPENLAFSRHRSSVETKVNAEQPDEISGIPPRDEDDFQPGSAPKR